MLCEEKNFTTELPRTTVGTGLARTLLTGANTALVHAPICASRPATLPAATWCMPRESDDSKSAMVVALPAMTAACSAILVLAASKLEVLAGEARWEL